MRRENYCYWTVAPGELASDAAALISSAQRVGVFKDFHVWTDGALLGATVHPIGNFNPLAGIYRLTYLYDAVAKLEYDHYVWVDPNTRFTREPGSVLRALRRAPAHVPLTVDLSDPAQATSAWGGAPSCELVRLMRESGIGNRIVFAAESGFFIVHRHVVETFFRLAFDFWHACEREGWQVTVEAVLAYAMQMLAGDPRLHHISHCADLWLPRPLIEMGVNAIPALVGGKEATM